MVALVRYDYRAAAAVPLHMMSFDPDEDDDLAICIWDEKCFKATWTKLALAMANYWRRLVGCDCE